MRFRNHLNPFKLCKDVYNHDSDLMSFESTFYGGIIVVINQYIIQNDKSNHILQFAWPVNRNVCTKSTNSFDEALSVVKYFSEY